MKDKELIKQRLISFADQMKQMFVDKQFPGSEQLITELLQNQFKFFTSQKEIQHLIFWKLSVNSPLIRSIHNTRESNGSNIFRINRFSFCCR